MHLRNLLFPSVLLLLLSCGEGHPQDGALIPASNNASGYADTPGKKISTVSFQTRATGDDVKEYEDGIIPWVNLDDTFTKIKDLVNPNEAVIPYQKVVLVIDYPVAKPVFFEMTGAPDGFTRKQIILAISRIYHRMYDEEEKTAKTKTIPAGQRKTLINRNETNGKYGIWGHDLSDLDLSSLSVYKNAAGNIFIILDIES